jgi:hypothetical protein
MPGPGFLSPPPGASREEPSGGTDAFANSGQQNLQQPESFEFWVSRWEIGERAALPEFNAGCAYLISSIQPLNYKLWALDC